MTCYLLLLLFLFCQDMCFLFFLLCASYFHDIIVPIKPNILNICHFFNPITHVQCFFFFTNVIHKHCLVLKIFPITCHFLSCLHKKKHSLHNYHDCISIVCLIIHLLYLFSTNIVYNYYLILKSIAMTSHACHCHDIIVFLFFT